MPSRTLPFPRLTFSYMRYAMLIWVLLRVGYLMMNAVAHDIAPWAAVALFGTPNPGGAATIVFPGLAVGMAWFEHQRSGENSFHSSLGAHTGISVASAFVLVSGLELLF